MKDLGQVPSSVDVEASIHALALLETVGHMLGLHESQNGNAQIWRGEEPLGGL